MIHLNSFYRGDIMDFSIDIRSGVPIYTQIYQQLKDKIINGTYGADEQLPSVRVLAKDLGISVITTKRAYDDLQNEGFIYSVPGRGFYVSPQNTELLQEENRKKLEASLLEAIALAPSCGLDREDFKGLIDLLWSE